MQAVRITNGMTVLAETVIQEIIMSVYSRVLLVIGIFFIAHEGLSQVRSAPSSSLIPIWTTKFENRIEWQMLSPDGHLILALDSGFADIDTASGTVRWQILGLHGAFQEGTGFAPNRPYIIVNKRAVRCYSSKDIRDGGKAIYDTTYEVTVLDYTLGKEIWNGGKLGSSCTFGEGLLPSPEALLVCAWDKSDSQWVTAVNLDTGLPIWKRLVNADFGKAAENGLSPMIIDRRKAITFLAFADKLFALRNANGSIAWQYHEDGSACQMNLLGAGLLVKFAKFDGGGISEGFLIQLDAESGDEMWLSRFPHMKKSTNFIVRKDSIIVYSDRILYSIKVGDGEFGIVGKGLKLKGGEIPVLLSVCAGGYVISSFHSVMGIDFSGKQVYNQHFTPVDAHPFLNTLGTVAALTATIYFLSISPGLIYELEGAERLLGQIHDAVVDYISSAITVDYQRFGNSINGNNFIYLLADFKLGNRASRQTALVKLVKQSGEIAARIDLNDKTPSFTIDEANSRLFITDGDREIVSYKF